MLQPKNIAQLAEYQCSIGSNGRLMENRVTVGLLLDEDTVRFSFSPWVCDNMPLPIVLVSPPVSWRNGALLDRGTCINLCMVQKLFLPRIAMEQAEAVDVFSEHWPKIEQFAKKVKEQVIGDSGQGPTDMYHFLSQKIQMLESTVRYFMESQARFSPELPPPPLPLTSPSPQLSRDMLTPTKRIKAMDPEL